MRITIDVPDHTDEEGIPIVFEDEYHIRVWFDISSVVVEANQSGMITLARTLLSLACNDVPSGYHIHLDSGFVLGDDSVNLTLMRT